MCAECFTVLGEARQQRGRRPECLVDARLCGNVPQRARHFAQAHLIRMEHRAAAPGGEAVAVEVYDVDMGTALRDAVLDDARPFIDEWVDAALDDFFGGRLARRDALLAPVLFDDVFNLLIWTGIALTGLIAIPPGAGFLSE